MGPARRQRHADLAGDLAVLARLGLLHRVPQPARSCTQSGGIRRGEGFDMIDPPAPVVEDQAGALVLDPLGAR
jgi:hypothetical protein